MATIAQAIYDIADTIAGRKVTRKGSSIAAAIDALNDVCAGSDKQKANSIYSALELLKPYIGKKSGGSAVLIQKTVTENGVYDASSDSADGYSVVTVDVEDSPLSTNKFYIAKSENSDPGIDIFSKVYVSEFPYIVNKTELTGIEDTVAISMNGEEVIMDALAFEAEAGKLITVDVYGDMSSSMYEANLWQSGDQIAWKYVLDDALGYPIPAATMEDSSKGFQVPLSCDTIMVCDYRYRIG